MNTINSITYHLRDERPLEEIAESFGISVIEVKDLKDELNKTRDDVIFFRLSLEKYQEMRDEIDQFYTLKI